MHYYTNALQKEVNRTDWRRIAGELKNTMSIQETLY